ncbi:uncharacterized protein LOC108265860 isoform X2 [Ictalurus punctatus]|nr:uncharacterized protein LOC108265860 isoform X2 [Ictalurus punctatus]XP_017324133.1 uncharacterized protein LOC108265860 isoform X2 [Ictalurus punctatus]
MVLVLHYWSGLTQGMPFISANCRDDIRLPCSVSNQGSVYRYVVWYKNETAIIKRKYNDVTFYNKSSPASLGVQDTLVLQNVQPFDSGIYQCFLAADVGQKDRESFVLLTVSECVTVSPTWTTSGGVCIQNVVEVSILWSLVGFSLFSLCKIIFCTIIVTVCKKQRGSEARRRSGKLRNDSCKHRDKRHL